MEVLLKEICGVAATAVAERLTTAGVAPSLPWTVSVPVKVPVADGVTATVKLPDWPVATDNGSVTPVKLNCGLDIVACVIETGMVPVFATATVWVGLLANTHLPKVHGCGANLESCLPRDALGAAHDTRATPRIPVQRTTADRAIEFNTWGRLTVAAVPSFLWPSSSPISMVFPSASFIT